jgi:hypothetical protein
MILSRRLAAPLTAAATCLAAAAALTLLADHAQAATTSLCGTTQTTPVSGGAYTVQNNEWNSSASECITTDGGADFSVANSAISNSTSSAPGGYPSIYKGCQSTPSGSGCTATYSMTSSWPAGFQGQVTVANNGRHRNPRMDRQLDLSG